MVILEYVHKIGSVQKKCLFDQIAKTLTFKRHKVLSFNREEFLNDFVEKLLITKVD